MNNSCAAFMFVCCLFILKFETVLLFSAQSNMDLLNGAISNSDNSAPSLDIEDTEDEVATTCVAPYDTTNCKNICTVKPSNDKKMNKQQSSGYVDSERGEWLLAAVRRVRGQKQRPNVSRIMNTLRIICPGKFRSRESLVEELELAVSEGILLRVGAVGDDENCSYRDPGRVVRLKSHSLHVTGDLDMTKLVTRSVRELADSTGSTAADLCRYIQSAYKVQIYNDSDLAAMVAKYCQKAVDIGKLVAVESDGECRFQPVYSETKKSTMNCTKAVQSSSLLSSYSLIDRAFKTSVSELHLLGDGSHIIFFCHKHAHSWSIIIMHDFRYLYLFLS